MFENDNKHKIHKEAVQLVLSQLSGAVDMDSVAGYFASYDIEWRGFKFIVRAARPTHKEGQSRAKWFYPMRKNENIVADFFIFFTLVEDEIQGIYVIPKEILPKVYVTITSLYGNQRYQYFKTDINNIQGKISEVIEKLPKIKKMIN
jgi:hypothetical protein